MPEAKRVWVHIRTSEYGRLLYIDGKQKSFRRHHDGRARYIPYSEETIGNEPYVVDFTHDDFTDFETFNERKGLHYFISRLYKEKIL